MRKDHKPDGRVNNGGRREGAGRPPGIPNAPAAHLRDLCRRYTPEIVEKLWEFVVQENWEKKDPWLAFAAMKELNDRAWGKPRENSHCRAAGCRRAGPLSDAGRNRG